MDKKEKQDKTATEAESEKVNAETEKVNAEEPKDAVPETNVVDELTQKYNELNEKHLRLAAEFENYKKRVSREQENQIRYANEKFARDIVDILDNFERALKSDDENLRNGLEQIHKLYMSVLEKNGIKPMNAKGTQFDPEFHEAVVMIPSDKPSGEIIDIAVPGYMIRDKVLRHAKVVVSAEKQDEQKKA
ncbi:MAG: nucleotide exchange factor GrpE [Methanocorpusculum sp.]|nr:nucleotide exchange factor GrpE [Methanocorpusculum sp.]